MKKQYALSTALFAFSSLFASAASIGITSVSIIEHGPEQNASRTAENALDTFGSTIDGTRDAFGLEVGEFTSTSLNNTSYTSTDVGSFLLDFDLGESVVLEQIRLFSIPVNTFGLMDFELSFSDTSDFSSDVTTTTTLTLGQNQATGQTFDLNIAGGLSDAQRDARYVRIDGLNSHFAGNANIDAGAFASLAYVSFAGAATIPEPSTYATILGLAILPLLYMARRRR